MIKTKSKRINKTVKGFAVLHKDSGIECIGNVQFYREWSILSFLGKDTYIGNIEKLPTWLKHYDAGWRVVRVDITVIN